MKNENAELDKVIKQANKEINKIIPLIKSGSHETKIKKSTKSDNFDEIFSVAKARILNSKIKKLPAEFFFNEEDLRWATNQIVANYRAIRLECDIIVDVGCGIGMQAIAFAKTCNKVIAIDIDPKKIEYATLNAKIAGVDNIEFICKDAKDVRGTITKADTIFCDPQRPAQEATRKLESLSPNIPELIKAFDYLTPNFCIELPPQMREIPLDCEKEYISINHEVNRLNAYLGKLKQCEFSACILKENGEVKDVFRLTSNDEEMIYAYASPLKYIFEIDSSVEKANLKNRIPIEGLFFFNKYLTCEKSQNSEFFKAGYRILKEVNNHKTDIQEYLKLHEASKAILHGNIDPNDYWELRKYYEEGLDGNKTLHLFIVEDQALICEKIF